MIRVNIHWKAKSKQYHLQICEKFDLPMLLDINDHTICSISKEAFKGLQKAVDNGLLGISIIT